MDDLPAAQALSDTDVAAVVPVIYEWSQIRKPAPWRDGRRQDSGRGFQQQLEGEFAD